MLRDARLVRVLLVIAAMALVVPLAQARGEVDGLAVVQVRELPKEAREVLARIEAGGPFTYDRDGVVFGNRERILPGRPRGYYHEYTVPTPGAHNRAARRIVCGGPKRTPDACFYSDDHYQSFRRIVSQP